MSHLGKMIRKFRIKAKLTQKDLAVMLGIKSSRVISQYENDQLKISAKELSELIYYLKIPESQVKNELLSRYELELKSRTHLKK